MQSGDDNVHSSEVDASLSDGGSFNGDSFSDEDDDEKGEYSTYLCALIKH